MAKERKKWRYILGFLVLVAYILISPRPIPEETVLTPRWISSLESNHPISLESPLAAANAQGALLPFVLGNRFGYIAENGYFSVNQIRNGYVSISANHWAEYEALPALIEVMNPQNESVLTIENPRGYPLFLDNRIFIVGSDQHFITAINQQGEPLWTYDFPAPLTSVDAAAGFLLAGTLDGEIVLLNPQGNPAFPPFEPGGSRLSVILGSAISQDASRLAIISGIEEQRFLLMERSGDGYQVVYHEFLGAGFRRPVHITFINNDSKVVFEREGGLGIHPIGSRSSLRVDLEGELAALDDCGEGQFLFVITSHGGNEKRFISIRHTPPGPALRGNVFRRLFGRPALFPAFIVNEAAFRSENVFFSRINNRLYIGGDLTMASLKLEKK